MGIGGPRPLYARTWLLRRVRLENRIANRLDRWSRILRRDAKRLIDDAVTAYRLPGDQP